MSTLQVVWFLLIGVLLVGYAILDGFDLGVGFLHLFTKKEEERHLLINSVAPVWDGNEVWLLTGGGALFAAFPPVYATVFSGFYLAMMLVLCGLIFRAVAIEFHHQVDDPGWRRKWDLAFGLGSLLPALLFGVALGNVVRGLQLDANGDYTGGFLALLNPYALLVGVTGLAMFALQGALYLVMKTEGELLAKARSWVTRAWSFYLVLFLLTTVWSLVSFQRGSPVLPLIASGLALGALVAVRVLSVAQRDGLAFVASSVAIASVFAAVGSSLFPNMVPASNNSQWSLTIFNASSSQTTLFVMLLLAGVGMPLVIGYTIYIYRTFRGKVRLETY